MSERPREDEVDYEREGELFDAALGKPAEEREAFVRAQAGDDAKLAEAVLSLLRLQPEANDFLERSVSSRYTDPSEWVGRHVGAFRIERPIAHGGMGMVFLAEQEQPRRKVAVKILRSGKNSPETLRRFEIEAEVLARLDHPHIAKIYDAGTVEGPWGPAPYLAMEYVDGRPLTEYADAARLSRNARVDLWIQVCEAVHHAHLHAVIHRDLKPANILVREDGRPAVLDFGVARITDAEAATLQTQAGQIVGTVAYMSPEQLRGDQDRIDLRSDVYALGVLGHELLLGRLPHDLQSKSIGEAVTAVTTTDARLDETADRLPEDLRAILGACLQRERDDRYASAAELAHDLQRFRRDEPIELRTPPPSEQLRRFARRHRAAVIAASVALLALVVGLAVSVAGWNSASRARRAAESASARAALMNDFLGDMLTAADPRVDGRDVKVVDVLERASSTVDARLRQEPEVALQALTQLGDTYSELGVYDRAEDHFRRALDLADSIYARQDPRRLDPLRVLGSHLVADGAMAEAESLAGEVRSLLASDPPERNSMGAFHFLGSLAEAKGERKSAEGYYRRAYDTSLRLLGPEHYETLTSQVALGVVLFQLERLEEAQSLLQSGYDAHRRLHGEDNPYTQVALNNLAFVYKARGDHERALEMFRRSLQSRRRVFGEDAASTAVGEHNLALQLSEMGQPAEAIPHHERSMEIFAEQYGSGHPRFHFAQAALGGTLHRLERWESARQALESAHAGMVETIGAEHWRAQKVAEQLVDLCTQMGDTEAAKRYNAQVLPGTPAP